MTDKERLKDIKDRFTEYEYDFNLKKEDIKLLINRVEELEETLHVINAVRYIPDEVSKEVQRALEKSE